MRLSASSSCAAREFLFLCQLPGLLCTSETEVGDPEACGLAYRYGIIEIARTGVVGMARSKGAFSNMIQDGVLVERRVLERLEVDSTALPPG